MDAFCGEIRVFGFSFAPMDWAFCHGQSLSFAQYEALGALLAFKFGGDGQTEFNLPDLRGAVPVGYGSSGALGPFSMGETRGTESVALAVDHIPSHTHAVHAKAVVTNTTQPQSSAWLANSPGGVGRTAVNLYSPTATGGTATMAPQMLGVMGTGTPHENRQPFLAMTYCICLFGLWPS